VKKLFKPNGRVRLNVSVNYYTKLKDMKNTNIIKALKTIWALMPLIIIIGLFIWASTYLPDGE
jgi:hypothetical protein|tara:strand:+ start:334 stop:522 length:189 start_codon:yes stop_codon:yes gene_type:complete